MTAGRKPMRVYTLTITEELLEKLRSDEGYTSVGRAVVKTVWNRESWIDGIELVKTEETEEG